MLPAGRLLAFGVVVVVLGCESPEDDRSQANAIGTGGGGRPAGIGGDKARGGRAGATGAVGGGATGGKASRGGTGGAVSGTDGGEAGEPDETGGGASDGSRGGMPGAGGAMNAGTGGSTTSGNGGATTSGRGGTSAGTAGRQPAGGSSGASAGGGAGGTGGAPATGGDSGGSGMAGSGGIAGTAGTGGTTVSYSTNFDLVELPLSESGKWYQTGLDWTPIGSKNGDAYGTQVLGPRPESQHYNDSYAYLAGFPANHRATATIHRGTMDTACTHEVELLLRWADAAHTARGYECNLAYNGEYAQIVRWNGPYGDYTPLAGASVAGVQDGDVLSAEIVGNTITLRLNGSLLVSTTDSQWADGNPGIGLYRGVSGCGSVGDYGFTNFTAISL